MYRRAGFASIGLFAALLALVLTALSPVALASSSASPLLPIEHNLTDANYRWRNFNAFIFAAKFQSAFHVELLRRN